MSDIERAFQMLDLIQGHPGYGTDCVQCGQPMTNAFGVAEFGMYPQGVGTYVDHHGPRHDLPSIRACPIAYYGSNQ